MLPARIKNPAMILPDVVKPLQALYGAVQRSGIPVKTLGLVHLRSSQINGCSFCVDSGVKHAKQAGETDERLHAVAAWRESPHFSEPERAALALSEAVTRLADRSDPVPDPVWDDAAQHYDEAGLAVLVLWIGVSNLYNRLNVSTRQPAGSVNW